MMSRVKANGWQTDWRCLCTKLVLILYVLPFFQKRHAAHIYARTPLLSLSELRLSSSCLLVDSKQLDFFPRLDLDVAATQCTAISYILRFSFLKNIKISNSHFLHVIMTQKRLLHLTCQLATHRNWFDILVEIVRISNGESCCSCHSFSCQITNQIRFPKLDECQFVNES